MSNVMDITRRSEAAFVFDSCRYPEHPGCYLMKNAANEVIYVGKANSLRSRLASYFRRSAEPHRKAEMISRIREIDVFLVRNEREALVLESNLIRSLQPTYNSRFTHEKDSYYYIARTSESFPRFVPFRKRRTNYALGSGDEPAALFGPYVGWRLRDRLLAILRQEFSLRTCHTIGDEACVRAQSDRCSAPCIGRTSEKNYTEIARRASRFLRRPPARALRDLGHSMAQAADEQSFEEAATLRDQLRALEHAALPQVAERTRQGRMDVVYADADRAVRLSIDDGILTSLESLAPIDEVIAELKVVGKGSRLIGNGFAAEASRFRAIPLQVPRSATSYIGQLLEIARLNFDHQATLLEAKPC